MFNLKYLFVLAAIVAFGISAAPILGQTTAPVRGVVKLKAADGSETPVVGATVESYQTDIGKGVGVSTTTNKKGEFTFVGFQLGHVYALAVSGTGLAPQVQPNIKAGNESVQIVVSAGDGRKPTEEEVRQFIASGAANKPADPKTQSKEDAEYQKKVAQYNEQKKKAEDSNKIVNASFQEGDKLYKAKDYDAAIAKFDEGINADPEFEGSAPILLNYKAVALKDRGVANYNKAVALSDAAAKTDALEKTKADLLAASAALDRALDIIKKAPAGADATAQKNLETTKKNILSNYVDVYRLIVKTHADPNKGKEAGPVFQEYLAMETEPAAKLNAHLVMGDMAQEMGDSQAAIDAYSAALQLQPENPDALAGMGLSLVNQGYLTNDKTKFQDGVNYLQKFVSVAPDTHKFKKDAADLIEALKKEQNVTPQKVAPARKKP